MNKDLIETFVAIVAKINCIDANWFSDFYNILF